MSPPEAILVMAVAVMAIMVPTLQLIKSESGQAAATYNPQRIMRQVEYDQGA